MRYRAMFPLRFFAPPPPSAPRFLRGVHNALITQRRLVEERRVMITQMNLSLLHTLSLAQSQAQIRADGDDRRPARRRASSADADPDGDRRDRRHPDCCRLPARELRRGRADPAAALGRGSFRVRPAGAASCARRTARLAGECRWSCAGRCKASSTGCSAGSIAPTRKRATRSTSWSDLPADGGPCSGRPDHSGPAGRAGAGARRWPAAALRSTSAGCAGA